MIRKLLSLIILFVGYISCYAQNKEVLYDFQEIPQAIMVNPGMNTIYNWYAGIPFISGIYAQGATSGLTVNDIFAADGLDINQKVRDRALNSLSERDEVNGIFQVDILNGGFRSQKNPANFFSFGMYVEGYALNYWPKDLAILAYEGNADRLGQRFDLNDLNTSGQFINVLHFGINRQIKNNLTLGARIKLYSGIIDIKSTNNSGYFETTLGQNNLLRNTLVSDMKLRTSGLDALIDANDNDSSVASLFTKRGFFGGDPGLGFDLGVTYNINDQTVITGSLLDIGLLYHSSDVTNYTLNGSASVEGVEVILPDALNDPNADFWEDLVDEIEELVPFEEDSNNYVSFRPIKFYSSIRYNFGKQGTPIAADCECDNNAESGDRSLYYLNSVGGQLYAISRPRGPQFALTAFYQRRFAKVLALKATYTVDKFTASNVGLGMSLQAGPVNFYIMGDNLFSYGNVADSNYASFQLGLNIISWESN